MPHGRLQAGNGSCSRAVTRGGLYLDGMKSIQRAHVVIAAAALGSLVVVAAGCGSDSPTSGVAQTGTRSTDGASRRGSEIAFAACMRSHGVPDFPDPRQTSTGVIVTLPDDDSPRFRSAYKGCRRLLPNGGAPSPAEQVQEQSELLKFAACMRSHGVPDFPDPTFSRGRSGFPPARINRGSPRFGAAKRACAGVVTAG